MKEKVISSLIFVISATILEAKINLASYRKQT